MGCCCSTPLEIEKHIIKIEDFTIDDLSQNLYELGTCFTCNKIGVDVKWYNDYNNTYCDKCYHELINFRLNELENL